VDVQRLIAFPWAYARWVLAKEVVRGKVQLDELAVTQLLAKMHGNVLLARIYRKWREKALSEEDGLLDQGGSK
jgi:hypothetical protein